MTEETHQAMQDQDNRRIAEVVRDEAHKIDEIHSEMTELANTRKIRGKSLEDWNKEFSVPLDYQADPSQVNKTIAELFKNLDTAYKMRSQAKFERSLFANYFEQMKRGKISEEAYKKGKRTPAYETLEKLAQSSLGSKTLAKEYYDFEVDFWDSVISKINTQVRLVNTMTMSNGTRYKIGEIHG